MDITKIDVARSAKGNNMLVVDGFLYHYEDSGLETYRWVCNKRKDKFCMCRARLVTKLIDGDLTKHAVLKVVGEHSHDRCSETDIFKVMERKRLADVAGKETTTPKSKAMKRAVTLQKDERAGKQKRQKKRHGSDDEDDDETESADGGDDDIWSEFGINSSNCSSTNKAETKQTTQTNVSNLQQNSSSTGILASFEQQKVYMLKTAYKRPMICVDGFLYRLEAKAQSSPTYRWECLRQRDINCEARIHTTRTPDGKHTVKQTTRNIELHMHEAYTPGKLSRLLLRHNIQIVNERVKNTTARTYDEASFEEITCASQVDKINNAGRKKRSGRNDITYQLEHDPLHALQLAPQTNSVSKTFTFLPSAKGNKVLCLDNYTYHYDSCSRRNGHSYWTCTLRRDRFYKCNGRVITEMTNNGPGILKVSGTHLHPPNTEEIMRRLTKELKINDGTKIENTTNDDDAEDDDVDDILNKTSDTSLERRVTRGQTKIEHNSEAICVGKFDDEPDDNFSNSSFASVLNTENDSDENSTKFPNSLEEMRQKVADSLKNPLIPKVEMFLDEEQPMEEEYLDHFFENERATNTSSKNDVFSDTHVDTKPIINTDVNYQHYPDMNVKKVSILRSAKGTNVLCVDGYIYYLKATRKGRTHWVCIKSKLDDKKCKSRVVTVQTPLGIKVSKVSNYHTHPISERDIKRRLYNDIVANGISKDYLKPRDVLNRSLQELSTQYAEIFSNSRSALLHAGHNENESSIMKLFAVSDGPPSLAVRMTLQALQIPYELVNVDFIAAEHMTEEYAKMNPQKEIPVLDDKGFYLPESIAIMQYLCDRYATTDKLYPQSATQRAIVNHRLCFNMGFYYASISAHAMAPIFFDYQRSEMSLKKVNNALSVFETYLERAQTKYAAADQLTIADFALVSSTLCLEAIDFDLSPYPLVQQWYATFKRENPDLWAIANGGMEEIAAFEKNPPDLSHMNHPFHPTRKVQA